MNNDYVYPNKECKKCNTTKPSYEFQVSEQKKKSGICADCMRKRNKEYRKKHCAS